jgi:hypothetical protein
MTTSRPAGLSSACARLQVLNGVRKALDDVDHRHGVETRARQLGTQKVAAGRAQAAGAY